MRDALEQMFQDNPTQVVLAGISGIAVIAGLFMGVSRGAFSPSITQNLIENAQQSNELRKQFIKIANERFDAGCEGVFYLKPGTSIYQPLTEGSPILSGDYWNRWTKSKGKLDAALTDYLPAGTSVCDAYGNVGTLTSQGKSKPAIVSGLLNTPDRNRITTMMKRYPNAHRPQVGG